jgi:choline dehydrogenase-like flavoprotein
LASNGARDESYSLIVVGTGFASTFFLLEYLKHAPKNARVLVLERGRRLDPMEKLRRRATSDMSFDDMIVNRTPQKQWLQNISFGGGACWTGTTPRMHPNDFRMRTLYGVSFDWPLTYDDIEPYYVRAERLMGIGGANEGPYPRSAPYPFPAHRMSTFDELLAKKYPGQHIPLPSARSSSIATGRPICCANGVCSICPIGAKFQVDLHMADLYTDPRITLRLEANVQRVDIQAGQVAGVQYLKDGQEQYARTEFAAVGAHAIMTPYILLRSGLKDRALGRYLNEQIAVDVQIDLAGVNNFDGGQQVSALGLMFLDGPFRSKVPGCLVESWNVPWLRAERGRWRQRAFIMFGLEDIPSYDNYVGIAGEDPSKPEVYYPRHSDYMRAGFAAVGARVEELIKGLPVESYYVEPQHGLGGSAHIQGTTRMGTDPAESVVDSDQRHHSVRNLMVLGGSVFPTCHAANPTLTLSALSLRAAERLFH